MTRKSAQQENEYGILIGDELQIKQGSVSERFQETGPSGPLLAHRLLLAVLPCTG